MRASQSDRLQRKDVRKARHAVGVKAVFKRIDTCAAEFEAQTPYMYSTYEAPAFGEVECEARPSDRKKVVILGWRSKPHRSGYRVRLLLLSRLLRADGRGL